MDLKPYPRYKDSGIEWLERMPESWIIKPVWMLFKLGRGRVISREEIYENPGEYPVYSSQTESNGILGYIGTYGFDGKYITWTTDGANAGTLFYREGKFNCTNVCGTLYPQNAEINLKYFTHLINIIAPRFVRYDINPKLMNNVIAGIKVLIPPFIEQNKIANFLDQKTAKIDALIKKDERLVELLKEKRQAIISHAVTKGLDPNAKMKDSGIEWIGEIPEGWGVKRLKFMALVRPSNVDKKNEVGETEVRLCNYIDVYNNESIDDSIDFMVASATSDEIKKFRILRGDVLITKDSEEWNDIAVPSFVNGTLNTVLCGYHLALVRPEAGMIEGKYLFWSFQSYNINTQFRISANGITRYGLSKNSISSAFSLVPPLPEQSAIANYLDQKTARIDGIIKKIQSQIEKLKEYRQALISNVVTGKVKVAG